MKEFIKRIFTSDGEVDVSRRRFIKGAASLAALTVVSTALPSVRVYETLKEQIATGLVTDQTFYIDEPIVIDMNNIIIRNCKFIATRPLDYFLEIKGSSRFVITDCQFQSDYPVGVWLSLSPNKNGDDMSTSIQSAIDNSDRIHFGNGEYKLGTALKAPSNYNFSGGSIDAKPPETSSSISILNRILAN